MDHIVYLDAQDKEMEKLLAGEKTMIIRGAAGRKLPHGRVDKNDILYFVNNNGEGLIKAKALVLYTIHSEKLTVEESSALVGKYAVELNLSDKQYKKWAGKRYIVLISVENIKTVEPFKFDKSSFGNMDDWLTAGDISKVIIP